MDEFPHLKRFTVKDFFCIYEHKSVKQRKCYRLREKKSKFLPLPLPQCVMKLKGDRTRMRQSKEKTLFGLRKKSIKKSNCMALLYPPAQ